MNIKHYKRVQINRKNKTNAFFDPVHKKRISSLGGKTQGKINAQNGHLKRIAQLPRNRNPKFCLTYGIDNIKLDVGIDIPDGYRNGKTQRKTEPRMAAVPEQERGGDAR